MLPARFPVVKRFATFPYTSYLIIMASALRFAELEDELSEVRNMNPTDDADEREFVADEIAVEADLLAIREVTVASGHAEAVPAMERIPWIGGLRNPHIGPMVVLDDSGYLVPLCTAGDLLRGFRSLWRV